MREPDQPLAADLDLRRAEEALTIDVDGFEGPLDLLLMLARSQKVDLRRISVLALAEQYLSFVEDAQSLRIELAADYLVMASWLAFLKSRLLLPPEETDDGPSGEDLAAHLAFQLERLEGMRRAAEQLMGRDQLGRQFFARGAPQAVTEERSTVWDAKLIDLLQAYSRVKTKEAFEPLHYKRGPVYTMEEALERMRSLIGSAITWQELSAFLPNGWVGDKKKRRSALAASFAAALELVKAGQAELRQGGVFEPLELRAKAERDGTVSPFPQQAS